MKFTLPVVIGVAVLSLFGGAAQAADLGQTYRSSYCPWHESSAILTLPASEIEVSVQQYYDAAGVELRSEATIVSNGPAFTWASETRFACNKALAYFRGGAMDEESVQKCDCFYRRMTTYR